MTNKITIIANVMTTSGKAMTVVDAKTITLGPASGENLLLIASNSQMYPPPTKQKMSVSWHPPASRLSSGLAYLEGVRRRSAADLENNADSTARKASARHSQAAWPCPRVYAEKHYGRGGAQERRGHEAEENVIGVEDKDHPPNEEGAAIDVK